MQGLPQRSEGIYCTDRKKVIQECKNPIAEGNFKWIFACNCEGTEQLRMKDVTGHEVNSKEFDKKELQ